MMESVQEWLRNLDFRSFSPKDILSALSAAKDALDHDKYEELLARLSASPKVSTTLFSVLIEHEDYRLMLIKENDEPKGHVSPYYLYFAYAIQRGGERMIHDVRNLIHQVGCHDIAIDGVFDHIIRRDRNAYLSDITHIYLAFASNSLKRQLREDIHLECEAGDEFHYALKHCDDPSNTERHIASALYIVTASTEEVVSYINTKDKRSMSMIKRLFFFTFINPMGLWHHPHITARSKTILAKLAIDNS